MVGLRMRQPPLALMLLCCLTAGSAFAQGLIRDHKIDRHDDNSDSSEKVYLRILDFRTIGLYSRNATKLQTGAQIVNKDFYLYVFYAGRNLAVIQNSDPDHFTIVLNKGQSLDSLTAMLIFKNQLLPSQARTCSMTVAIGAQNCKITEDFYIKVEIIEQIQLHSCSQSSTADPKHRTSCHLAITTVSHTRLTDCAITAKGDSPWWQAEVSSSFQFEKVEIYASADLNQWTRSFDISIESSPCVSVRDKEPFIKRTFQCGQYGSRIRVRARGSSSVQLAICEIAAYGSPGGCFDIHTHSTKCMRTLPGHIGQGSRPYPAGLNCQWMIAPHDRSMSLLLQFPEFGTAGPGDRLTIYEGRGTYGRVLATFYGSSGGSNAPPKYEKPGIYGAKRYLLSGKISNAVTIRFVTARANDSSAPRTAQTHRGFVLSYTVISEDEFPWQGGSQNAFNVAKRACTVEQYTERLLTTCTTRGGINPIYLYGNETGGPMLEAMAASGGKLKQPPIDVALIQEKLGLVPFTMPEFDFDLTDEQVALMCGTYRPPEVPPRYFNECCCSRCSNRLISKYCLWDYGEPSQCQVDLERVEGM